MSAFDTHSGLLIPFESLADALVARLRLEEGLGNSSIKLFLDLVHNPSVDLSKLSFRDASQIDDTVAAYKSERQYHRSFISEADSAKRPTPLELPYPILEGILDTIANDDTLVDEPAVYQIPLLDGAEFYRSDCLRNMALVHRSWTLPAQQRLARRIIVRSPSSVLRLLRSPIPCLYTRELIISIGDVFNRGYQASRDRQVDHPRQYLRPGDIEEDLASLLKRMTNLRSLTVKESGLREDRILSVVSTLKSIETLRWHCAHGQPSCDFTHLVEALRSLPKIKDLEITGWSFHATNEIPAKEAPLGSCLESLKLCISPGDSQMGRFGWLVQSLSLTKMTSLTLDVTLIGTLNIPSTIEAFPALKGALGCLSSLHLINKGGFMEYNLTQARLLVQACHSLRRCHVQSQTAPVEEFLDYFPNTLEELTFSWFDMWMSPWGVVENALPPFIQSEKVPKLKKITVHNYEIPFVKAQATDCGEPFTDPCPKTNEVCRERSIELDLWAKPPDWRIVW
ncbi:hypothetical protein SCHPADRAFT_997917 [Schizopora paradoxa]|uniref:Uncharacterized protein n=1 Tax=Schizopora paradoxa TaxID=27342 RepID=A0A0H2RTD3_9AGAM|nr:hypothetical protein SCHPADRAFT_997917 [Schizopora paradoxa]